MPNFLHISSYEFFIFQALTSTLCSQKKNQIFKAHVQHYFISVSPKKKVHQIIIFNHLRMKSENFFCLIHISSARTHTQKRKKKILIPLCCRYIHIIIPESYYTYNIFHFFVARHEQRISEEKKVSE